MSIRTACCSLCGLFVALTAAPAAEPARQPAGVVYVVGGIGGFDPLGLSAKWTFPRAGVPHEIRDFQWTHGRCRPLRDLQDSRYFEERATELAALVRDQAAREPSRPIFLVGHSAGAGLVLRATELLPPLSVERVILLSPAVSPHYDLRPALKNARGEIVSFNSTYDRFILDLGTSLFGTVDRYYEPAAGLDGFRPPTDLSEADRELYRRLVQVPYRAQNLLEFQGGSHHGTTMPVFLAKQVVPWLAK
jgi:pimeloyl-ACP methyl ester carboxylesterase